MKVTKCSDRYEYVRELYDTDGLLVATINAEEWKATFKKIQFTPAVLAEVAMDCLAILLRAVKLFLLFVPVILFWLLLYCASAHPDLYRQLMKPDVPVDVLNNLYLPAFLIFVFVAGIAFLDSIGSKRLLAEHFEQATEQELCRKYCVTPGFAEFKLRMIRKEDVSRQENTTLH